MLRHGVSVLEFVVVAVVLTALAALITPQVSKSAFNTKLNQTTFKLQTIRAAIAKYARANGAPPPSLAALTTDSVSGAKPLLKELPKDSLRHKCDVQIVAGAGKILISGEVQVGGWVYNQTTGEVRVNLGAHRDL